MQTKSLMVLLCLFFAFTSHAQSHSVHVYKCYRGSILKTDVADNGSLNKLDGIVVSVDATNKKIDIYTTPEHHLYLLEEKKLYKDGLYTVIPYSAIDEEGIKCHLEMRFPDQENNDNDVILFIRYTNITIIYKMTS